MTAPRFTLRQLDIFATVVRTGQVRRAAEVLHLSQAAVSQALRELALALDVTLFERHGRALIPTADARQLLELAAPSMAALGAIDTRLSPERADQPIVGRVVLAASSTITRYILPQALARLRREHPGLAVTVVSGNSATAERRVADFEADLGFIEGPSQRDDLDAHAWATDTLQIIAPPDYPTETVAADNLARHAWVAREPGSGTRAVFEHSLALAGLAAPHAALVIDDSGSIVRAVAAGAGLACVSRHAATQASALSRVQFIDLPSLALRRPLWRVERRNSQRSALIARLIAALTAALPSSE
ncbi:LysR substrate-binding domain-containing protein [Salinisphaera sp. T31B1]|uniref:LysR substrate-binding domain-containing protein n=1 Tax=Salinisphaera sp. T31B1 TaxID=727963 RepID=UPI0033404BBD